MDDQRPVQCHRKMDKIDGSVSGAAIESPDGQAHIADAVQQTTGFTPAAEPHDEKHQPLREDQIQNAVAFLAHPKVLVLSSSDTIVSCPKPCSEPVFPALPVHDSR